MKPFRPRDFWLWRAFVGGCWEYQRKLGWYPINRSGEAPPRVERSEDNRDLCWPVRITVIIVVAIFAAVLA